MSANGKPTSNWQKSRRNAMPHPLEGNAATVAGGYPYQQPQYVTVPTPVAGGYPYQQPQYVTVPPTVFAISAPGTAIPAPSNAIPAPSNAIPAIPANTANTANTTTVSETSRRDSCIHNIQGRKCSNPNCHYAHLGDPDYNPKNIPICRFGAKCTKWPDCPYGHPEREQKPSNPVSRDGNMGSHNTLDVPLDWCVIRNIIGEHSAQLITMQKKQDEQSQKNAELLQRYAKLEQLYAELKAMLEQRNTESVQKDEDRIKSVPIPQEKFSAVDQKDNSDKEVDKKLSDDATATTACDKQLNSA